MSTRSVQSPLYMRDFKCIGPACEDTCCAGWRIDIDRETYGLYEQLNHPDLPELTSQMERNETPLRDEMYGRMKMTPDLRCPQLNEKMLCKIQSAMGESYLSAICSSFPRLTNIVDSTYEMSASMSCPEAARLALLNPEGISFAVEEEPADRRHVIQKSWPSERPVEPGRQRYFPELRAFTIRLLKNRNFPLHDRILMLALFYEKLQEVFEQGDDGSVPVFLEAFTKLVEDGSIKNNIDELPPSVPDQIRLMRHMIDLRLFSGVHSKRYLQCLNETLGAIGYLGDCLKENTILLYKQSYERYYAPFMAERHYILENYLVNAYYQELLPKVHKHNVVDSFLFLIAQYALIQFHLIGMAAYYQDSFSEEHVIKLIQSFTKTMEHTGCFHKKVLELLKSGSLSPGRQMAVMIRMDSLVLA